MAKSDFVCAIVFYSANATWWKADVHVQQLYVQCVNAGTSMNRGWTSGMGY